MVAAASPDYDVFISYSRHDAADAVALQNLLEGRGYRVFRDEARLRIADHIEVALPEALSRTTAVCVLWSGRSVKSPWVRKEATVAWGVKRYLPLALADLDRGLIPKDFGSYHALRLVDVRADPTPLLEAIDALKRGQFPTALQVEVQNGMPASGSDILVGREAELAMLDGAWSTGETRLVVLDAMGGTGKTALINTFLDGLAAEGWRGAQRVYCWSFYSQGTDEKRQGDADGFFEDALAFFGHRGEPITNADRRGRRLADLVKERRTLLVLDGLEPLQFPANSPGQEGALKDDSLKVLLKQLALQMNGLAIVTTRIPVPELKGTRPPAVIRSALDQLIGSAGVTLLKRLGVRGADEDLADRVGLLGGHALSLNLLASYATEHLGGHLPVKSEIERLLTAPEVSRDSYVMMRRYEILLEERSQETTRGPEASAAARQLALLYLIGLFDRPAERDAVDVLLAEPIAGLTDTLGALSPGEWRAAIAALRRVKLLLPEAAAAPGELDAHPLVREYFGERLRAARPEAFAAANLRLYEHYKLKDIPPAFHDPVRYALVALAGARGAAFERWLGLLMKGEFPPDRQSALPPALRGIAPAGLQAALEESDDAAFDAALLASQPPHVKAMASVIAAIAHGAAAERHDAAFHEVYLPRMARGNEAFMKNMLGALGAELSVLAHFFRSPFAVPAETLAPADRSLLLGNSAFRLRALGRLAEAEAPMVEALAWDADNDAWENAAISAGNLSDIRLAVGKIAASVTAAAEAVAYADRSGDQFQRLAMRTTHADVLHQAGNLAAAARLFAEAEAMQVDRQEDYPMLYSLAGYLFCNFRLSQGDAADVARRGRKLLEWRQPTDPLLDIALDTLTLGRAALARGDLDGARPHLEASVDGLREAAQIDDLPRGLLAGAEVHRRTGAWGLATVDLDEIDDIAARCGMRLFEVDALLERARLALARDPAPDVAALADRAKALIAETGYRRRIPDHALVAAEIAARAGDRETARRHLAEAATWIGEGWRCHVREHARIAGLIGDAPPTTGAPPWWQRLLGGA